MKAAPLNSDQHLSTAHLTTNLKQRFVNGGMITLASQGSKFMLQLGSNVVLARLLTPQDYGYFGMTVAITGFISLFKDLGLSTATVQRSDLNHEQVSTLFWVNVGVSLAVAAVTASLAPLIARFYQEPILVYVTLVLSIGYLFGGLTVQHQALLSRQMRFTELAVIDITALAAGVSTAIVMGALGYGVWALVLMQLVIGFSHMVGVWCRCQWRPTGFYAFKNVKSMIMFGRNLTGFNLINYVSRNLDNILIGRVWGPQALGFYAKAYQLLLLPIQQINAPIARVTVPALSRLNHDPERYRKAYLRILRKLCLITLPLVAFMVGTSNWLIALVLGPKWLEAGQLFAILGIMALVQPIAHTTGWLFTTQDRTWEQLRWGAIGGGITILAILIGLPWGAVGVAIMYSSSGLLLKVPILFWLVGRKGPVKTGDIYQTIAPFVGAALLSLGMISGYRWLQLSPNPLVNCLVGLSLTVISSLTVLSVTATGRQELHDTITMALSFVRKRLSTDDSTETNKL